jgi:uncharacterized membrane protein
MGKTFKREIAIALLIGLGYVVYIDDIEMVEVLVWPVFTFAAAAFGLDSYAKQVKTNYGSYSTEGDPNLRK